MPHWGEIFSETAFVWYSDTQTKMLVACQRFGDSFFWGPGLAVFYKTEPI